MNPGNHRVRRRGHTKRAAAHTHLRTSIAFQPRFSATKMVRGQISRNPARWQHGRGREPIARGQAEEDEATQHIVRNPPSALPPVGRTPTTEYKVGDRVWTLQAAYIHRRREASRVRRAGRCATLPTSRGKPGQRVSAGRILCTGSTLPGCVGLSCDREAHGTKRPLGRSHYIMSEGGRGRVVPDPPLLRGWQPNASRWPHVRADPKP